MNLNHKKGRILQFETDNESEEEEKTSGSEYKPTDNELSEDELSGSIEEPELSDNSNLLSRKRKKVQKVVPAPKHDSSFDSSSSELNLINTSKKVAKRKKIQKTSIPNHKEVTNKFDSNQSKSTVTTRKNVKKRKKCEISESDSTFNSSSDTDSDAVVRKQKMQETLGSSVTNSSLDLSINIKSVGPVLQNKQNEFVMSSDSQLNGCKTNVCYYCFRDRKETGNKNKKVHYTKLVEHYETAHKNENDIAILLGIPKTKIVKGEKKTENQKRREAILEKLRNKGNHLNNLEAEDSSDYVVARRPKDEGKNVASFGTCYKCYKQLSLTSIHKHVSKCTGLSFKHRHAVKSSSRATIGDYCSIASPAAINIIKNIREDDILNEIRYDEAIFIWLNAEASKYETVNHYHNKIRANLRRLGRLKLEMRLMNDKIVNFSDIFHENNYDQFIEACKILGKAEPDTKFLNSAATANDMSFLIKNVAAIYHVMIGEKETKKRKEIDAFVSKIKTLWHSSIGNTIAESQAKSKRNKIVNLPSKDDLTKLREYLEKEMLTGYDLLRMKYTDDNYSKLRNSIESYLHLTNCRRAGEIERLSLEDFNLMQMENDSCLIRVRGKRTKPVPIVFNSTVLKYLKLLIKHRKNANISEKNPYIFSTIHDTNKDFKFTAACVLMTRFAEKCGANVSETLRGTLFRKQVATEGAEKGINEHEVEKLSNFLGHTPRIHHQNCRQSVFERDVAVSNLVKEAQSSQKVTSIAKSKKNDDESEQHISTMEDHQSTKELNESSSSEEDQECDENEKNAINLSISSVTKKRLPWTRKAIDDLMAYFPNGLKKDHKVPCASEINNFLNRMKDDTNFKSRTEPQVRSWFHINRKNSSTKNNPAPVRNNIPTYIYAKFEKYISAEKLPSIKRCAQFIAESPSRNNLTIKNVQDWVEMAIKRKSQ